MRMQLRLVAALLLVAPAARADGLLEVRGGYYKERSTRVEQPMVDAWLDTGDGRLDAHFLIDSITSASVSTGAAGQEFTERRYEAGIGYMHQLPGHVKIGAEGKYSTERDYISTWLAARVEVALFDQNTTLRFGFGHSFDQISNNVAVENAAIGLPLIEKRLGSTLASLGADQLLTPWLVAQATYDFMWLEGYQANLYRRVNGGTQEVEERVPDRRIRHAFALGARAWLPTSTTAVLTYRLYLDDWGVVANTIEARAIQPIIEGLDVRARYRFYTQGAADFYRDVYTLAEVTDQSVHVTADAKLSSFHSHTLGLQLSAALSLLGVGGDWGDLRLDVGASRVWQTSAFGNAWVAEAGISVPFSY
jgi:Protein of unknown function (DUF3570)